MDGILKTKADARRRLGNSADGIESVIAFLWENGDLDKETRDASEVLRQQVNILRRVQGFTCFKED